MKLFAFFVILALFATVFTGLAAPVDEEKKEEKKDEHSEKKNLLTELLGALNLGKGLLGGILIPGLLRK